MTTALITTTEASSLLEMSRQNVLKLVNSGRLTPVQKLPTINGTYLFAADDVAALAEERKAARPA